MGLRSSLELLGVDSINEVLEILGDGFRFQPTDEELMNYLKYKAVGFESKVEMIPVVDVNKFEPWDLPDVISGKSCLSSKDQQWFCFSSLYYKYKNSKRCNRLTVAGYWKPTGKDRPIKISGTNRVIGCKKTLVFYKGRSRSRSRSGIKTNWIIHEYHRKDEDSYQSDMVICHLMKQPARQPQETHESNVNEENTDSNMTCDIANETTQNTMLEEHVMTQNNHEAFCAFPYQRGDSEPSFIVQSSERNERGISISDLDIDNELTEYENHEAVCDFPYQHGYSDHSIIVQSSELKEPGISISDLDIDNELIEYENHEALCDFPYQHGDSDHSFIVQSSERNELGSSIPDLDIDNELTGYEKLGLSATDLDGNEGTSVETDDCIDSFEEKLTKFANSLLVYKDDEFNGDITNVLVNDSTPQGPLMFSESALNSNADLEVPVEIYSPNYMGGYISPIT